MWKIPYAKQDDVKNKDGIFYYVLLFMSLDIIKLHTSSQEPEKTDTNMRQKPL